MTRLAILIGSSLWRNCADKRRFLSVGLDPNSIIYLRLTPVCFIAPHLRTSLATAFVKPSIAFLAAIKTPPRALALAMRRRTRRSRAGEARDANEMVFLFLFFDTFAHFIVFFLNGSLLTGYKPETVFYPLMDDDTCHDPFKCATCSLSSGSGSRRTRIRRPTIGFITEEI